MFSIDRVYELAIDLSEVSTIQTKIDFKQFDYNSCFINLVYHNSGTLIENIKENNVIGVFKSSDGKLFIDENTNKPVRSLARTTGDGKVIMMIPDEVLKHKGKITCETIIITPTKKRITSSAFIFNIQESLFDIDFE